MNTKAIQTFLASLGYELDVDGALGPATKAAIESFQRLHGLEADGVWGPATKAAADALGFSEPELMEGIDVSAFCCGSHGVSLVHWPLLVPKPRFAYARASFGIEKDGSMMQHVDDASTIGTLTGTYHFFDPHAGPAAQAATWFAASGPQAAGKTLKPAFDIEQNRPTPLTDDEAKLWATSGRAVVERAEDLFQRELVVYTNPKTAFELRNHLDGDFWGRRILWLAAYASPGAPATPWPWTSYACHQWAGDVHIEGALCLVDRNVIFGQDGLTAMLG